MHCLLVTSELLDKVEKEKHEESVENARSRAIGKALWKTIRREKYESFVRARDYDPNGEDEINALAANRMSAGSSNNVRTNSSSSSSSSSTSINTPTTNTNNTGSIWYNPNNNNATI